MSIKKLLSLSINFYIISTLLLSPAIAGPVSTTYELKEWDFYAGSASSSSTHYVIRGDAGEYDAASVSATNYRLNGGLTYDLDATIPPAPTLTNPSNYDTQLKLVISKDSHDTTSTKYAISISTDDFVSDIKYVQADHSISTSLNSTNFQTYTLWGGASGFNITGLTPGSTYRTRVSAMEGFATQSKFGQNSAQATTVNTTITYDIDVSATDSETAAPYTIDFGDLTPGNVITPSNKIWLDLTTNAGGGSTIYISNAFNGLKSSRVNYTITSASANLSSANEGYGLLSSSATQTSGGPFTALSPYNGASNNVGLIDSTMRPIYDTSGTSITNGRASLTIKAKSSPTTPASSDYADTITIIVAPVY